MKSNWSAKAENRMPVSLTRLNETGAQGDKQLPLTLTVHSLNAADREMKCKV